MDIASAPRLGVAGTPEFAVPVLERLAALRAVRGVFTQPDRPAGRGREVRFSPMKRRALELGLAVHQPATFKTSDAADLLRSLDLDLLVVIAYGLILPASVLAIPKLGCVNIHASVLPRWRGAAPIQRAILAGDAATGITIMRMDPGLDTGPMFASREMVITDLDTAGSVHDRLAAMGADLMLETLPEIESGRLRAAAQPERGVTYAQKIEKAEAHIDWLADAAHISRQVRAFNPWPIADTFLNGQQVRIWEAVTVPSAFPTGVSAPAEAGRVLAASAQGIDVACGAGVLRIGRLQMPGRKPLSAEEFLRGRRLDGVRFGTA